MGPNDEKDDGMSFWFYPMILIIIFIRMAQPIFSLFKFFIGVLLNNETSNVMISTFLWKIFDTLIAFCFELTDLFRWLVWISSIFKLMILQQFFGPFYVLFLVIMNDQKLLTEQYSRQYRRGNLTTPIRLYDERLMILSGFRIYAYLAKFYCQSLHTIETFLRESHRFQCNTYDRLWFNRREVKPPWPNIFTRMYHTIAFFLIFLSVFLMVLGLASDIAKRKSKSYIYAWKFRMLKECKLIPT